MSISRASAILGVHALRKEGDGDEVAFPDCVVRTNEARALLGALFPKAPSDLWPVT